MFLVIYCSLLGPRLLVTARVADPKGSICFCMQGRGAHNSCGKGPCTLLQVRQLSASSLFWSLVPTSGFRSTSWVEDGVCCLILAWDQVAGCPQRKDTHLHQVTVVLQHAAGGLPGVLVALPGVHPAGATALADVLTSPSSSPSTQLSLTASSPLVLSSHSPLCGTGPERVCPCPGSFLFLVPKFHLAWTCLCVL